MRRLATAWPVLLLAGLIFAVLTVVLRPAPPIVQGEAQLDTGPMLPLGGGLYAPDEGLRGGLRKVEDGVVKRIEYEWPARFTVGEMATVVVRFRDPQAAPARRAADRSGASASLPRAHTVNVLLEGDGFDFQSKFTQERQVTVGDGDHVLSWHVVPRDAPFHKLMFRFSTTEGDLDVEPTVFEPAVRNLLGLPSWLAFRGALVASGVSNLLAVPGLLAIWKKVRKRKAAPPAPAAAPAPAPEPSPAGPPPSEPV